MESIVTSDPAGQASSPAPATLALPPCLNCGAPLTGGYCAMCGQPDVDLTATTWHVLRDAVSDAIDVDGRALQTARALASPGRLTVEFLRGRRAPYLGPVKLFVLAGAILSTTWVLTRGIDARFYGLATDASMRDYIDRVVRGSLAAGATIAVGGWMLSRGRRRFLDEAVFALHVIAALSLWGALIIWVASAWKSAWGTVHQVPAGVPSLVHLVFVPAAVAGLAYVVVASRRTYGVTWWLAALRAIVLTAIGAAVILVAILASPA